MIPPQEISRREAYLHIVLFISLASLAIYITIVSDRWSAELREQQRKIKEARALASKILYYREDPILFNKPQVDPWGTTYKVGYRDSKQGVVRNYYVISAGPDKIMDTPDDIKEFNTDTNATNVGKVMGLNTGRIVKGFVEGVIKSNDGK